MPDRARGASLARVQVPTFLVGQFQDEQTGGHFVHSLGGLARNPKVWLTLAWGASGPEATDPSSAVTVCGMLPVFVQVTVSPAWTRMLPGW